MSLRDALSKLDSIEIRYREICSQPEIFHVLREILLALGEPEEVGFDAVRHIERRLVAVEARCKPSINDLLHTPLNSSPSIPAKAENQFHPGGVAYCKVHGWTCNNGYQCEPDRGAQGVESAERGTFQKCVHCHKFNWISRPSGVDTITIPRDVAEEWLNKRAFNFKAYDNMEDAIRKSLSD